MRLMHTFTRAYYRNEFETVSSHPTLMNLHARLGLARLDPGFWVLGRSWDMGGTPPACSAQNLCHQPAL